MARPREFDEDEVLERAMEAFWTHGYEATSLADLTAATGLAKGSLYKGFGDKRSLFLRALERYLARGRGHYAALDDGVRPANQVLAATLALAVEMNLQGPVRKGCFQINCSVELAPHDTEIRKRLRAHERSLEDVLMKSIERGIEEGSIRKDVEPRLAARWLHTVIGGIAVASKTGMTRADADTMVKLALDALKR